MLSLIQMLLGCAEHCLIKSHKRTFTHTTISKFRNPPPQKKSRINVKYAVILHSMSSTQP